MKEKLKLYYVDMKYIRDLHNVDSHVASVSPQTGKEDRPFIGVITIVDNKKYCIPLTSGDKEKFKNKKNSVDFIKIPDENKKNEFGAYVTIGGINLNNMIPVNNSVLSPIDITIHNSDNKKQINDKKRLTKELDWCQRNEDLIRRKANKLYDLRINHSQENIALTKRCCNFKRLEEVLAKYTMKTNKNNPDNYYYILIENEEQLEKLRNCNIPFKINKDKTAIIVDISDKERAKKCISEIQSKKNQHKPKL